MKAKKKFGQNWLKDEEVLNSIVEIAEVSKSDTVLEIGPGLGYLTKKLAQRAGNVVAVEIDQELISNLNVLTQENPKIEIINQNILDFDLRKLNKGYKVVANIPYYLTSNIIRLLLESENSPTSMVIMVQKEVAERIVAKPAKMSILSFSVQYYAQPELVMNVGKEYFEPIPKVDSSLIRITKLKQPVFEADNNKLFRLVKAGFAEKRKMLRNSLAGGLNTNQEKIDEIIKKSNIKQSARAQELGMEDWRLLYSNALKNGLI